jgi:hypothetical protein
MPVSKKRKGHNKKVQNRNSVQKAQQNAMQKLFNESMKSQIEEMKKKEAELSGQTQNQ